jgi:molybdopterin molybdotransferase
MLTVDEALDRILAEARPLPGIATTLDESLGRVLAESLTSDIDSPPHDKSMVDGYAVKIGDVDQEDVELQVNEEITAGQVPTREVTAGTASRVMTGAPVPVGTEAVVMVEQTEQVESDSGQRVKMIRQHLDPGAHIMARGTSIRHGDQVLQAGTRIRPLEIGLLAEIGKTCISCISIPRLAVLSTGNELVPAGDIPAAGQIRNSNGPMLSAQARRCQADVVSLGIARDDREELEQRIAVGLDADILVLSGGVSAGVLDLVPAALAAQGVTEVFHKVELKPGKPLWYGQADRNGGRSHVFGLPGNPVSSLVCFELFVRPLIDRLAGRPRTGMPSHQAQLKGHFRQRGNRPTFHPAYFEQAGQEASVEPVRWQGSADQRALTTANCLAYFSAGQREFPPGSAVPVFLFEAGND